MTKQHFEAIARAMHAQRPTLEHFGGKLAMFDAANDQWERDVRTLAAVFAEFNPRFDAQRFTLACGGAK